MKIALFFSLLLLVFLPSCTRDDGGIGPAGAVSTVMTKGTWTMNEYSFDGNDRLYLFGGYRFTFGQNGNVLANRGSVSAMGTWSSSTFNGKSILFFDFASTPDFSQLNGNWDATNLTQAQVSFQRTNASTGGTDFLSFQLF